MAATGEATGPALTEDTEVVTLTPNEPGGPSYHIKFRKWRQKSRLRTTSVCIVVCLNLSYTSSSTAAAKGSGGGTEAWVHPTQDSLKAIGAALQRQYQQWKPRAMFQQLLDPTVSDCKRSLSMLRRGARGDRILFHYNGHGVPKPTPNGEIWVFNRELTQYIPMSIFDLFSWIGSPAVCVFDVDKAGLLIDVYRRSRDAEAKKGNRQFAPPRHGDVTPASEGASSPTPRRPFPNLGAGVPGIFEPTRSHSTHSTDPRSGRTSKSPDMRSSSPQTPKPPPPLILFGAVAANETLPQPADGPTRALPADLMTACLTTPLKVATRWCAAHSALVSLPVEQVDRIPGSLSDRKTPLGELSWIFTAVTDSIAWTVLPPALFNVLFRQDLLVASLFRNFLLAQRVFTELGRNAQSLPAVPNAARHPMWDTWDMAVEFCLAQLEQHITRRTPFEQNPFFQEQLKAFEVWLECGSADSLPPPQLPIVLQMLLSQTYRLRALLLLAEFVDKGSWAVNLALGVGVFPYFLKLLQTQNLEARRLLVFIWTKILSLDHECQQDLLPFVGHLVRHLGTDQSPVQKYFTLFILSAVCDGCPAAQHRLVFPNEPSAKARRKGARAAAYEQTAKTAAGTDKKEVEEAGPFLNEMIRVLKMKPRLGKTSQKEVRAGVDGKTPASSGSGGSSSGGSSGSGSGGSSRGKKDTDSTDPESLLRLWTCLGLARSCDGNQTAKKKIFRLGIPRMLVKLLLDPVPEVRAAAVYALGTMFSPANTRPGQVDEELYLGAAITRAASDMSPIVRREVTIALGNLMYFQRATFAPFAERATRAGVVRSAAASPRSRPRQIEEGLQAMQTLKLLFDGPNPRSPGPRSHSKEASSYRVRSGSPPLTRPASAQAMARAVPRRGDKGR